jgi:hypothetical protein
MRRDLLWRKKRRWALIMKIASVLIIMMMDVEIGLLIIEEIWHNTVE